MASVELLSPAGGWESLKAAVENGADAVYLGVGAFNARRRAENFTLEDLPKAVSFSHQSGVKAYLAANTLVKNRELPDFFSMLEGAYSSGIDAVILQELSFIKPVKESLSDLEVHVSTQAAVFNSFFSHLLSGADRVIMPREMTLSQVRNFREKTGLGVEVFVQGALCFSVSGQCLMSSFLGGRSGNRGMCAQPCRKKYGQGFLLSTADLCLAEKAGEIVEAGVSALKIEGRLRSPEYVAAATCLYRRILDSGTVDLDAFRDLELAFNRSYTSGMLFRQQDVVAPEAGGKRGISLGVMAAGGEIVLRSPLFVGDGLGIVSAGGVHGDVARKILFHGKEVSSAKKGWKVVLSINAAEGDEIFTSSGRPQRRPCRPKKKNPISVVRRRKKIVLPAVGRHSFSSGGLLVKTYSLADAKEAAEKGAKAYYDLFAPDFPFDGKDIMPYVPRCLPEWKAEEAIRTLSGLECKSVLCGDPGVAVNIKAEEVFLDISANAFNDLDVSFYNGFGVIPIISPELSFSELSSFADKRFAVYAHGRIPLMTTKYVLSASSLQDEMGYVFPVRAESDYKQVLNSVPSGLFDGVLRLRKKGIEYFFLDLDEAVGETVDLYRRMLSGETCERPVGFTLGNFRKGVI